MQAAVYDCLKNEKCSVLSEKAEKSSDQSDYGAAIQFYQQAYDAVPDPRLMYNIARLLDKQKQTAPAIAAYQKVVKSDSASPDLKRKAQSHLERLAANSSVVATENVHPTVRAPTDSLTNTSNAFARQSDAIEQKAHVPAYKKWWFWTLLGGTAAAAITAGVVIGVKSYVSQDLTHIYLE